MDVISVASVALANLTFIFIPCALLSLGVLLVLGIDDRFVPRCGLRGAPRGDCHQRLFGAPLLEANHRNHQVVYTVVI